MKFPYELMLWIGGGLCLLWLFFGWPPVVQWVVDAMMSHLHP
ncbi:MAG TPA: hypothetical protein VKT75_19075 [Acidobacteriaceae bacterium]|jgi:hypothetical protein|nr:hypothetical protein [Acidobacteriaceae bacterium]